MPITPKAIRTMFEEIAEDQPGLVLPTEDQIISGYAGMRARARGLGVARDVGFRMPTVWFAEGHGELAPVYLYRFDWATPIFKIIGLGAAHATELIYTWGTWYRVRVTSPSSSADSRQRRHCLSGCERAGRISPATVPERSAREPSWTPHTVRERTTMVIDRRDRIVDDLIAVFALWATRCSASGSRARPWLNSQPGASLGDCTVDRIGEWLEIIPPSMREPVLFAVPFFLLLLTIEWTAARKLEHLEDRPASGAYMARDAWASISMGLVSVATMGAWKFLALLGYAALYAYVAPWHLSATKWYTWVIALVGVDILFYLYHRTAHRVRLIWATHQAHHSSRYFNFATALRQKWNNSGEIGGLDAVAAGEFRHGWFSAAFRSASSTSSGSTPSGSAAALAHRVRVQHPIPPPSSSRDRPAVHRQELRRIFILWDRMFRKFPTGSVSPALRSDQTGDDLQRVEAADS